MKGHNISCLNTATASRSVSWPSLPLTHNHQFTSWPWHCLTKASLEVPHWTGRDKEIKYGLQLPMAWASLSRLRVSHPTRKLYAETLILVRALFWDWKTYFSPGTQVQQQVPVPPHNVKGSRWKSGPGKTTKNSGLIATDSADVHLQSVRYSTSVFASNLSTIRRGHFKASFEHDYRSFSSGKKEIQRDYLAHSESLSLPPNV